MKILVTGAGGFLGTHVVERLLAHGYTDIRCFLRERSKAEPLIKLANAYPAASVELSFGNLKSKTDCRRAVENVSAVFHLAAAATDRVDIVEYIGAGPNLIQARDFVRVEQGRSGPAADDFHFDSGAAEIFEDAAH